MFLKENVSEQKNITENNNKNIEFKHKSHRNRRARYQI